jgi:radical SAM family uncharacterized protein/radical SAM-linked protein
MSILDHQWFSDIIRPSRYLGNEFNSVRKNPSNTEVSIALAFPDVYEVGMSHLGLKILYHILNSHDWLAAERVFSPWVDLEKELRRRRLPLTTLESDRPLSSFDIIGFSLQYELSYTNVLNMLNLAGINFLAADRSEDDPLVIAGGPVCFNPEPVADFFDLILVGDGESAAVEICRAVREKNRGKIKDKESLLDQLRHIRGIYIPSNFRIHYTPEGSVDEIEPLVPDYSNITKAILPDIDDAAFPVKQVIPFTEVVHDRLSIEISRGCTRGCRFCQAGMIYRPVRERSPLSIIEKAATALRQNGYDDLSLLSLSSGDYSCIEPLLKALMDRFSGNKVAISLPSLRIDSLSPLMIEEIKRVRKTGFTLAVEAGSDRLRRIINKGLTNEAILDMAGTVYEAGWKLIKLYFMVGLPFEEEKDLHDIIDLAQQITRLAGKRGKKPTLNVSISTFVPKSHTPFMWSSQIPLEESTRRIKLIRDELKGNKIRVKWNQPEMSWLEGILSRGDRRLSGVIMEAWKQGARYDAWGEHFHMGHWEEAFSRSGLSPLFYLRERNLDEVLPWDHIQSGVTKKFLKTEWERAQKHSLTPDCREKCLECGVCDHKIVDPIIFRGPDFTDDMVPPPLRITNTTSPKKYRLTFTKLNHARYIGHLELARTFIRAFRRAELNLVYSQGFHPMPKVSFTCALPVGTESLQETLDIQLAETSDTSYLKECINRQLPQGIEVISVDGVPSGKKKVSLKETHFNITIAGAELKEEDLKIFLESDNFPIVKKTKKGERSIDARSLVKEMRLTESDKIELVLKHTEGPQLKPGEIIAGIFLSGGVVSSHLRIVKTKQELA